MRFQFPENSQKNAFADPFSHFQGKLSGECDVHVEDRNASTEIGREHADVDCVLQCDGSLAGINMRGLGSRMRRTSALFRRASEGILILAPWSGLCMSGRILQQVGVACVRKRLEIL
jgi:hypothetical protein